MRNASTAQPYSRCVAITTSDTVNIATGTCEGILVTTAGNVVFVDDSGNVTTITAATIGQLYAIRIVRVNATGTTATVSALYK